VRPVSRAGRAGHDGGFTFIEAAVVLAVLGILLAVGAPSMSNWMLARKAASAAGFYKDGFMLARSQAVAHNSASRLVLVDNDNGQADWRVDICFPISGKPCSDISGEWSTTSAVAGEDPDKTTGFRSVVGSASTLPASTAIAMTMDPVGADAVYFTPLGWVDSRVAAPLKSIELAPASARSGAFPRMRVALNLGGGVVICNPDAAPHSPKGCPP
jgi:type IV fimbrial biogenesis protein FimT